MSSLGQHSRRKKSCPFYTRKQTFAVHQRMSAMGQKRTFHNRHVKIALGESDIRHRGQPVPHEVFLLRYVNIRMPVSVGQHFIYF